MPRGVPTLGDPSRREQMESMPGSEVLGTIPSDSRLTDTTPTEHSSTWTREDGTEMTLTEPPPPWEVADERYTASDARRFVECPPNWRLHWVNPRLLDSYGWRDWQPVLASDNRVTVRVTTMVTPENYIRRGGPGGDILCWMWQGWYESIRKKNLEKTRDLAQSAVDKQQALKEEFARGTYGPYMRVDSATHPRFTQGEGRTMRDS